MDSWTHSLRREKEVTGLCSYYIFMKLEKMTNMIDKSFCVNFRFFKISLSHTCHDNSSSCIHYVLLHTVMLYRSMGINISFHCHCKIDSFKN